MAGLAGREATRPEQTHVLRVSPARARKLGLRLTTDLSRSLGGSRFIDSYHSAAFQLIKQLDLRELINELDARETDDHAAIEWPDEWPGEWPEPTTDDSTYRVIAEVAPDVAAAIDGAAATVQLPFWSREVVRNMLARLVFSLILAAYVAGVVLVPPWGAMVVAVLSACEISGPAAARRIRGKGATGPSRQ